MSAKDNFAQAMKELLNAPDNGAVADNEEKKAVTGTFSSFSQPESRPPRAPAPEKTEASMFGGPASRQEEKAEEPAAPDTAEPKAAAGEAASAFAERPAAPTPTPAGPAGVTVIAEGSVLVGDLSTAGDLEMNGEVKGNTTVAATLKLKGKIIGDIEADEVEIVNSQVKGNVTAKNGLQMDASTIIVGDVAAKNATINGKIKGNLTVEERGHFESKFTLVGNLVSGTVIIDEGAMLKGDIAITNAQTENITVDEPDFEIEI